MFLNMKNSYLLDFLKLELINIAVKYSDYIQKS